MAAWWFSTVLLGLIRHITFDTYIHRKTKQTGWKKKKRKNNGHYKASDLFLSFVYISRRSHLLGWAADKVITTCHHHTYLVELLSSYFTVFLLHQCCTIAVRLSQKIHKHEMEVQTKSCVSVMFLPSVESLLNQQCRSKMHRSYHRRNMHRYCTYSIFAFINPCFVFFPLCLCQPLIFLPLLPLWSVVGLSTGGREETV